MTDPVRRGDDPSSAPADSQPQHPLPPRQAHPQPRLDAAAPTAAVAATPLDTASMRPPPAFAPLFTLVNNSTTRSTHHPQVHYIFSDDDPDVLTDFLAQQDTSAPGPGGSASQSETRPHGRAMVLDLAPTADGDSWEVAAVSSLSGDWAVVDARVSRMEEDEYSSRGGRRGEAAADEGSSASDSTLMLRIEGVEHDPAPAPLALAEGAGSLPSSGSGAQVAVGREDYTALIGEFERRMGVMRRVVASGEERMRRQAAAAAAETTALTAELAAPQTAPAEEKGKEKEVET